METISQQNKRELRESCKGYRHITFWIKPNVIISQESAEAEVLNALKQFQKDKSEGKLQPVSDAPENWL